MSSAAGGCTGALFGPRVVLTAAHCIFDSGGNYIQTPNFQARRNGVETPYGTVTAQGAVYPIAYKNDGCNANDVTSQGLTDIGAAATFYDVLVEVEAAA